MTFLPVRDFAADKIPVAVTCRGLAFSRQAFYAWDKNPVSNRDRADAHPTNAALDVRIDDAEFGYRFVADELAAAGRVASERLLQRARGVLLDRLHYDTMKLHESELFGH